MLTSMQRKSWHNKVLYRGDADSLVSLSANIILFSDEASIATLYFTTDFSGIVQGFFDNIFDMCMSVHI
jgi:hypothetical protein